MFGPGQLISQQRQLRGWTQCELAAKCGLAQSALSRYESSAAEPTWAVLCRILAAMGMQPRVHAQACDITLHRETALSRLDGSETWGRMPGNSARQELDLDAIMRPGTDAHVGLRDLQPVAVFVDGLDYVLTGPFAMRMQGLACSVHAVELIVRVDSVTAAETTDRLLDAMYRANLWLWCPDLLMYRRTPDHGVVDWIVAHTDGRLSFRTRDTATEVLVTLTTDPLPPSVEVVRGDLRLRVARLAELIGDGATDSGWTLRQA